MPTENTVLITGGTGFLGPYVANKFLQEGYEVVIFDIAANLRGFELLDIADDIELITGDVADTGSVFRVISETNASKIVHLAKAPLLYSQPTIEQNPRQGIDINIVGSTNVFEAARTLSDQVDRVVWASTTGVYGDPEVYDSFPLPEEVPLAPSSHYGAAKAFTERDARTYYREFGTSILGLRLSWIYGARSRLGYNWVHNFFEEPAQGADLTLPFSPDWELDLTYVKDIAQAFYRAAVTPEAEITKDHRIYNISGPVMELGEAVDIVTELCSGADIEMTATSEPSAPILQDDRAARQDLGYEPEYDLETGAKEYIDLVRTAF